MLTDTVSLNCAFSRRLPSNTARLSILQSPQPRQRRKQTKEQGYHCWRSCGNGFHPSFKVWFFVVSTIVQQKEDCLEHIKSLVFIQEDFFKVKTMRSRACLALCEHITA